jgi:hypothetical protein
VAGWSLDAAEAVCADTSADVLDLLESLVQKSLVVASADEASGESRFTMLETIREFALRRLEEAGGEEAARWAMARHLRGVAGDGPWSYYGPDQAAWVARMGRELDNIRAVMAWAAERGHSEVYAGLAASVWHVMFARGANREAHEWLSRAVALSDVPAALRLTALASACIVAAWQGAAEQAWARELAIALEGTIDPRSRSLGLSALSVVAEIGGDLAAANEHALAAADAARGRNPNLLVVGLNCAANTSIPLGQLDEALEYSTRPSAPPARSEPSTLFRAYSTPWGMSSSPGGTQRRRRDAIARHCTARRPSPM